MAVGTAKENISKPDGIQAVIVSRKLEGPSIQCDAAKSPPRTPEFTCMARHVVFSVSTSSKLAI